MVTKKKTKWEGWISAADISPELLEKFYDYLLVYYEHLRLPPEPSIPGSLYPPAEGHSNWAHAQAQSKVPLTSDEMKIFNRLDPNATKDLKEADQYGYLEQWKEARDRGEKFIVPLVNGKGERVQ